MRIIAGAFGGRQFDAPESGRVHPMSEKVRGAIFNAIGDISGLTILDTFAGSGALSFEAASRGAGKVVAVEYDKSAQKSIEDSIKKLNLGHLVKLIRANASAWASTNQDKFDVVLLDPPYDNLQPELLDKLAARANTGGVIVLSLPPSSDFILNTKCRILNTKSYGDATLTFYRRRA